MKKLLNISVIAALAVLPLAANATPTIGTVPAEPVPETANTNVASTSFVRGAYNAAVAVANAENARAKAAEGDLTTLTTTEKGSLVGAINEVNTAAGFAGTASDLTDTNFTNADKTSAAAAANAAMTAAAAAQEDADTANTNIGTLSSLTTTEKGSLVGAINEVAGVAGTAVQSVTSGTGNGTIKVDETDVSVTGLGSAAFVNTGDLADTAGTYSNSTSGLTATTIQDAIDEVAGSVASQSAKVLKVYTTWNTDTNQEVSLTAPTPAQQGGGE